MNSSGNTHRAVLADIAHGAMIQRGLLPEFPAAALAELGRFPPSTAADDGPAADLREIRKMRGLPWASIDALLLLQSGIPPMVDPPGHIRLIAE